MGNKNSFENLSMSSGESKGERPKVMGWIHEFDQAQGEEEAKRESKKQEESEKIKRFREEVVGFYLGKGGSKTEVDRMIEHSLLREAFLAENKKFDEKYTTELEKREQKEFGSFHGFTIELVAIPQKLSKGLRGEIQAILEKRFLKLDESQGEKFVIENERLRNIGLATIDGFFMGPNYEIQFLAKFLDKVFPSLLFYLDTDGRVRVEIPWMGGATFQYKHEDKEAARMIREITPERWYILFKIILEELQK